VVESPTLPVEQTLFPKVWPAKEILASAKMFSRLQYINWRPGQTLL
jgi:hypothetical protein